MRTLVIIPVLLFSLLLGVPSYSSDFNRGVAASQNGDYVTAYKEWKPLAEEGNVNAQFNLSNLYFHGRGVKKDFHQSFKWGKLAAEQGNGAAQVALAIHYAIGNGVIKDPVLAYMWANLAVMNKGQNAESVREMIEERLSQNQLEEAQRLARECLKKNYKGC